MKKPKQQFAWLIVPRDTGSVFESEAYATRQLADEAFANLKPETRPKMMKYALPIEDGR